MGLTTQKNVELSGGGRNLKVIRQDRGAEIEVSKASGEKGSVDGVSPSPSDQRV